MVFLSNMLNLIGYNWYYCNPSFVLVRFKTASVYFGKSTTRYSAKTVCFRQNTANKQIGFTKWITNEIGNRCTVQGPVRQRPDLVTGCDLKKGCLLPAENKFLHSPASFTVQCRMRIECRQFFQETSELSDGLQNKLCGACVQLKNAPQKTEVITATPFQARVEILRATSILAKSESHHRSSGTENWAAS